MPTQVLLLAYWNARQAHTLHLLFHFSRKTLKVPQMQTASEMLRAATLTQAWAERNAKPLGRKGGGGAGARGRQARKKPKNKTKLSFSSRDRKEREAATRPPATSGQQPQTARPPRAATPAGCGLPASPRWGRR